MPTPVIMFTPDELTAFVNELKVTIMTEVRQEIQNVIKPKQQKTWLTRKEALEMTGLKPTTFHKRIVELGIEKKVELGFSPKYNISDLQKLSTL